MHIKQNIRLPARFMENVITHNGMYIQEIYKPGNQRT